MSNYVDYIVKPFLNPSFTMPKYGLVESCIQWLGFLQSQATSQLA